MNRHTVGQTKAEFRKLKIKIQRGVHTESELTRAKELDKLMKTFNPKWRLNFN